MDIVNLRDSALKLLKPVISYPEQIALSSRQVLPVDNVQSANMLLQEELNRLFEGEEYTPSIALETIDGVTTAYTTLTDMDHILYKYQPLLYGNDERLLIAPEEYPELNKVIFSVAQRNCDAWVPYTQGDELGGKRIRNHLNEFIEENEYLEGTVNYVPTEKNGAFHTISLQNLIGIDRTATERKWPHERSELHQQMVDRLSEGVRFIGNTRFPNEVVMTAEELAMIEGQEVQTSAEDENVDHTSLADRIAARRQEGGGMSRGGDGKSGEVVRFDGKPWTNRTDGSGE